MITICSHTQFSIPNTANGILNSAPPPGYSEGSPRLHASIESEDRNRPILESSYSQLKERPPKAIERAGGVLELNQWFIRERDIYLYGGERPQVDGVVLLFRGDSGGSCHQLF